jgi:spore coat polysaccharide biosynthesis predicted glycosyltransferase SpsG
MKENHVSFLTFGGKVIGTGHLYRCLAISEWLKAENNNINISFYLYGCDQDSVEVSRKIISSFSNYQVHLIDDLSIKKKKWEIVVVDLLNAPLLIMKHLYFSAIRTISIDNISYSRYFSDVAINPLYYNIEQKSIDRHRKIRHDYIGPEFQIISPKFQIISGKVKTNVKNILIIQGGADPHNIVEKIYLEVSKILSTNSSLNLHVVTGPAAAKITSVNIQEYSDRIFLHHNIKNMPNFLLKIDLAISSIGINAFEIATMGIPSIHVTGVNKELETGALLSQLGVSIFLGLHEELNYGDIYNQVELLIGDNLLLKKMSKAALELFNNKQTNQLINLILK